MTLLRSLLLLVLLGPLVIGPGPGAARAADAPGNPPASAVAATTAARPLTIADVIARADLAAAQIAALDDELRQPSTVLEQAAREVPLLAAAYPRDAGRLDAALDTASPLDLNGRLQTLTQLDRRLAVQRAALQQELDRLDPRRAALRDHLTYFARSRTGALADELPEALRQRVVRLMTAVEQCRARLGLRLGALVAQLDRLADLQVRVQDATQQIRATLAKRQRGLLKVSAPPLWAPSARGAEPLAAILGRDNALLWTGSAAYARVSGGEVMAFLLLYAGLLGLGLRLRRAALRGIPAPVDGSRGLVSRHPYAVMTLIWALLGPELLFPDPPAGFVMLRAALIAATLWLLLPRLVNRAALPLLRGLLAIGLLFIAERSLLGDPWYGRIVELVAALAGIFLLWRLGRQRAEPAAGWPGAVTRAGGQLARLAPPLLGAGFVATLVGALLLGSQLIGGILVLSLTLMAFVVADRVFRDLVDLFIRGPGSRWSRAIRLFPGVVYSRAMVLVRLLLAATFLLLVPRIVPVLDPLWVRALAVLSTPLRVGTIGLSLLDIVAFGFSVVIAINVARFVRFLLDQDIFPRVRVADGTASAMSRLAFYGVVLAGLMVAFAAAGVQLSQLTLLVSALGIGIGFGLQNIVNNFVSGLVIAFEHPFREGDQIAVGQVTGRIHAIGLRATRIRTFDGADVIVPNANLISGEVTNWTLTDRARRIEIPVGVGYGSDPRRVQAVLLEAATSQPGIATQPVPTVVFKGFGASSLDFGVLFWVPDADDRVEAESGLRFRIFEALQRAGIEIPFPQLQVHLRPGDSPPPAA